MHLEFEYLKLVEETEFQSLLLLLFQMQLSNFLMINVFG